MSETRVVEHISPNGYKYPYYPQETGISYVSDTNPHISEAREFALKNSLDKHMPNASVIVKNGITIGRGANGSDFHEKNENILAYGIKGCRRIFIGAKTGEQYDQCEGCHPKNHGEPRAIEDAIRNGYSTVGADIYMWGHWWCCENCCAKAIRENGIKKIFLLEKSDILFNKESPNNIVGKQYE
jgi:deoxycytidylate deaminase